MDLSAANLHLFKTDHWLKDPDNVVQLHVADPAWQTASGPALPLPTPRETVRSWTVAETVRFLQERDLEGPAHLCHASGVAGVDLMSISAEALVHDVRLTPFAAPKVIAAREIFFVLDYFCLHCKTYVKTYAS